MIERINYDTLIVDTAGLNKERDEMLFHPGISRCGKIKDGVSFCIDLGYWVVSFEDFEWMYKAAVDERGNKK